MAFHPENCVVIQVTTKRSTISADYTLHNHHLEVVDSSKYLGFTINKYLKWDEHITNISARANRTFGFLRRNLRGCRTFKSLWSHCSSYTRVRCFQMGPTQHRADKSAWKCATTSSTLYDQKLHGQTARECHTNGEEPQLGAATGEENQDPPRVAIQDPAQPSSNTSRRLPDTIRLEDKRRKHFPCTNNKERCLQTILFPKYNQGLECPPSSSNNSQLPGGVQRSTGRHTIRPVHRPVKCHRFLNF